MKKQLSEIKEIWEKCSFERNEDYRNMTWIGFLQAVQELGIKVKEKLNRRKR